MAWSATASTALGGSLQSTPAGLAERAGAIAQTPNSPTGYAVLHVSATAGNDAAGDGSQHRPYQTITHALSLAQANSLILLAAGTYSAASGETFPLRLRTGVTVQGMAGPNAADVVVQGTGTYRSDSHGVRQVTVLGADNAGLANLTVTNPHPEGTGLWIEGGSPIVLDSAFFGNGAIGIYIAGQGKPVIRGNYFGDNGQAGLVIAGPSTAEVEANTFENTGAGITVAPEATPTIVNNQISGNLDGLIVHAESRPTLQGNEIVRNRRNSIVDYAAWTTVPPLNQQPGATQPPPPAIATSDRPAAAGAVTAGEVTLPTPPATAPATAVTQPVVPPSEAIAAPPTAAEISAPPPAAIATAGAAEHVATEATARPPATESATPVTAAEATAPPDRFAALPEDSLGDRLVTEIDATAIALTEIDFSPISAMPSAAVLADLSLEPVVETVQALADATANDRGLIADPTEELETDHFAPLPSPGETDLRTDPVLEAPSTSPEVINIPVILPPTESTTKPDASQASANSLAQMPVAIATDERLPAVPAVPTTPTATPATSRLAVPHAAIPLGSGGSSPAVLTAGAAAPPSDGPPPPPSLAASLGLHYKVLVAASHPNIQAEVQAQVPDAFRRQVNGQLFIQAGAYPTLEEAQAMLNRLRQVGLPAQIEEIR